MMLRYTEAEIRNLPDSHKVHFDVNGYDTQLVTYSDMINHGRSLCCGKEDQYDPKNLPVQNSIHTIPTTVKGDPKAYTIHVTGNFEGFNFDLLLLAGKEDNYLYASRTKGKWRETCNPKISVVGARQYVNGFEGSYTSLRKGLEGTEIPFGFLALMRALTVLQNGAEVIPSFMCVVANMFEPMRFPVIQESFLRKMSQEIHIHAQRMKIKNFTPNARRLAAHWKKLSDSVFQYREQGDWIFVWKRKPGDGDGDFDIDETQQNSNHRIKVENVPRIIGLLKR